MIPSKVNSAKLKQALEKFGTLEKAVRGLRNGKKALRKHKSQLIHENARLKLVKEKRSREVTSLEDKHSGLKAQLKLMSDWKEQHAHQYKLFEGFLAMLIGSPSVTHSIESLIASLKTLLDPGWGACDKADEARGLFLRITMGDYLKSFRCHKCGASFIVNKEPYNKYFSNYYLCPACHNNSWVEPDDSFLKAMASEKQLENTLRVEELKKENSTLAPFKVLLSLPCEVCGKPVTEWLAQDVRRGILGLGWGHTRCFKTGPGQLVQLTKAVEKKW